MLTLSVTESYCLVRTNTGSSLRNALVNKFHTTIDTFVS